MPEDKQGLARNREDGTGMQIAMTLRDGSEVIRGTMSELVQLASDYDPVRTNNLVRSGQEKVMAKKLSDLEYEEKQALKKQQEDQEKSQKPKKKGFGFFD